MSPGKAKPRDTKARPSKTPRRRKPDHLSLEEWQLALRREYAQDQTFTYENLGTERFFSEFAVTNPDTGKTYRVAIRGTELGSNWCACPDFAVNTLGTCKHIEWMLQTLESKRGGKKAFRDGFVPPYSEVYLQYGSQRRIRFKAGLECPEDLRIYAAKFFDSDGYLRQDGHTVFERFVNRAAAADHEVRMYDDALDYIARRRDDEHRRQAIDRLFTGDGPGEVMSGLLKTDLYPYQQEGALFAARAGRSLIADDMGLGKTVQAIAVAEILARTVGIERVLVICPASVKHQWQQEVERFTDRSTLMVEGPPPERRRRYRTESFFKIVNYDVIHRDLELIESWAPDLIVLDEAQRIKNWKTRRAKSVKQLESDYALVLTGTPLENRLEELHSIIEFVDRFRLGPLFRFLATHQVTDEAGKVIGYRNLDQITESLTGMLIRRRKQDVLSQLPERTDTHLFLDLTQQQRDIHEDNRAVVAQIVARWRRRGFLTEQEQHRLMVALQWMRMVCNSTYLVDRETDFGQKAHECRLLLDDLLSDVENKVVIFSQWLGTHEIIMRRFSLQQHEYAYYHGSLEARERRAVIRRFKTDPECRVLFSTDAGGVGLNLQTASVVINMDQPWNPAVLEQRIGRVHRLGQERPVQVYHLVSRQSIEHSMIEVLRFKSAVFDGVLDGGARDVFLQGSRMSRFMDTVEEVTASAGQRESPPVRPQTVRPQDEVRYRQPEEAPALVSEDAPPRYRDTQMDRGRAWSEVAEAGLNLMTSLGRALRSNQAEHDAATSLNRLIVRDAESGETELRLPIPDAEAAAEIGKALNVLGDLFTSLGRREQSKQ